MFLTTPKTSSVFRFSSAGHLRKPPAHRCRRFIHNHFVLGSCLRSAPTVVLCPRRHLNVPLLSRHTAASVDFNWTPPTLPQAGPTCVSIQVCDTSSERSYAGRQMFLINNHSPPERQVRAEDTAAGLSWNTRHLEWPTDRVKFSVFMPQTDFPPRTVPLQQR